MALLLTALLPATARAEPLVDLELLIAADVSVSMDREERLLQQQGFAEAFRHPDIVNAIRSGATGRISVAYMEWGGEGRHRLVVPWTLIDDAGSASHFAARLAKNRPARFKGGTSIGSALARAHSHLRESPFSGARRVINISGDGVNNKGPDLEHVRAELLADGITINGLPIVYKAPLDGVVDDPAATGDPQLLIGYFERNVIGGPFAFVEPVAALGNYTDAIHRKLVREIGAPTYAGSAPGGQKVSAPATPGAASRTMFPLRRDGSFRTQVASPKAATEGGSHGDKSLQDFHRRKIPIPSGRRLPDVERGKSMVGLFDRASSM